MEPAEFAIVFSALLAGAVIQGAVGFGGLLVAVPVVALVDASLVPAVTLTVYTIFNLLMLIREREAGEMGHVVWALVGRVPGSVIGALILVSVPADRIGVLLGGVLLLVVALSASGLHVRRTSATCLGAGVLSGMTATTVSVGGPPVALVYQHDEGPIVRGALARYFTFGMCISLATLVLAKEYTLDDLWLGVALFPAVVIGFLLSGPVRKYVDSGYTRPAILAFAAASAVAVLIRSLL